MFRGCCGRLFRPNGAVARLYSSQNKSRSAKAADERLFHLTESPALGLKTRGLQLGQIGSPLQ